MDLLTKTINLFWLNLIIIVALNPLNTVAYTPPPKNDDEPQQANFTGSRGACPDYSQTIRPLFPKAENLYTTLGQPTFLIEVKESLKNPIYFSIIGDEQIYPLYQEKVENAAQGLLVFKVPTNIELERNKTYRLNFVIVCNEKRPSHNWLLTALITRRSFPSQSSSDNSVAPIEDAQTLSKEGLWFEALDIIYRQGLLNSSSFNSLLEVFTVK